MRWPFSTAKSYGDAAAATVLPNSFRFRIGNAAGVHFFLAPSRHNSLSMRQRLRKSICSFVCIESAGRCIADRIGAVVIVISSSLSAVPGHLLAN